MVIHYPNGQQPVHGTPTGKLRLPQRASSYADRGMSLETTINQANAYYRATDRAVIYKKPTPIQLVKVDYPSRSAAVVREAYFKRPSTTDYNGVYRGYYIDFDAKETRQKASFPLQNFHPHQVAHLGRCLAQGGICFAFIQFTQLDLTYLLPASRLIAHWTARQSGGRKSIPLSTIQTEGVAVNRGIQPVLDYLPAVDQLIAQHNKGAQISHE